MDAYIKYRENLPKTGEESFEECSANRKQFFNCVIEKKNELSKTTDFNDYFGQVKGIENECFESNSLANCGIYFNLYDLRY